MKFDTEYLRAIAGDAKNDQDVTRLLHIADELDRLYALESAWAQEAAYLKTESEAIDNPPEIDDESAKNLKQLFAEPPAPRFTDPPTLNGYALDTVGNMWFFFNGLMARVEVASCEDLT